MYDRLRKGVTGVQRVASWAHAARKGKDVRRYHAHRAGGVNGAEKSQKKNVSREGKGGGGGWTYKFSVASPVKYEDRSIDRPVNPEGLKKSGVGGREVSNT